MENQDIDDITSNEEAEHIPTGSDRNVKGLLIGGTAVLLIVSVGVFAFWRYLSGPVHLVNPKHVEVCGRRAWPSMAAIGEPVDLASVITPAATVPGVMAECAAAGVRGAVVISAGFKETGAPGAELERRVLAEARRAGLRLIGPNFPGVMGPRTGVNAAFGTRIGRPGWVGVVAPALERHRCAAVRWPAKL